jgi:hypothetical protein
VIGGGSDCAGGFGVRAGLRVGEGLGQWRLIRRASPVDAGVRQRNRFTGGSTIVIAVPPAVISTMNFGGRREADREIASRSAVDPCAD